MPEHGRKKDWKAENPMEGLLMFAIVATVLTILHLPEAVHGDGRFTCMAGSGPDTNLLGQALLGHTKIQCASLCERELYNYNSANINCSGFVYSKSDQSCQLLSGSIPYVPGSSSDNVLTYRRESCFKDGFDLVITWAGVYCLTVSHSGSSHETAKAACLSMGAQLVFPDRDGVIAALTNYGLAVGDLWLDLSDEGHEGLWTRSVTNENTHISLPWHNWEPNNSGGNEHCAIWRGGGMDDRSCSNLYGYVCEKQVD